MNLSKKQKKLIYIIKYVIQKSKSNNISYLYNIPKKYYSFNDIDIEIYFTLPIIQHTIFRKYTTIYLNYNRSIVGLGKLDSTQKQIFDIFKPNKLKTIYLNLIRRKTEDDI